MVDMPLSTRNSPAGLNRSTLIKLAALATTAGEQPIGVSGSSRPASGLPAQLSMSTLGGFKSAVLEFRNAAATLAALARMLIMDSPFSAPASEGAGKPPPGATRPMPQPTEQEVVNSDTPQARLQTTPVGGAALTAAPSATALMRAVQTFIAAHNQLAANLSGLTDGTQLSVAGEATPLPGTSTALPRTVPLNLPGGESGTASQLGEVHVGETSGSPRNNVAPAALSQPARRLLDALAATVSRWPGLGAIGLTPDREGGLRLDAGQLQAAVAAQPRTVAKLFSELGAAVDEAAPPPTLIRSAGAATTGSPPAPLSIALTEFREKAQVLTSLARLLASPTPAAAPPLSTGGAASALSMVEAGQNLPTVALPAPPATALTGKTGPGAPSTPPLRSGVTTAAILNPEQDSPEIETLYLHRRETLLSTALPRPDARLAALTIQIQAGRYNAATQQFVADAPQPPVSVASGDAGDTLPGLRDALRAGAPELGVAVVKDGAGYRLAVRLPEETALRNVAITLGKTAASTAPGEGQLLGFTVQRDADAVQKAVQSFVGAYNRLGSAMTSLTGDLQAQTLADPLRQALAGAMANPERIRTLAQAGVTVQRDSSLLIDPVRLQKAAEANPRRLLDPFADLGGDEQEDDDQMPALTDSFTDWLSDLGDDQETWDRLLDNPAREPALNPDGGRQSNSGLDAVAARCRARLETMDQLTRQLQSTEAWLEQALARLSGEFVVGV